MGKHSNQRSSPESGKVNPTNDGTYSRANYIPRHGDNKSKAHTASSQQPRRGFYPANVPGLGNMSTKPIPGKTLYPSGNGTYSKAGYIPRHAISYDPQVDITKSMPATKKVRGQVVPVTATYSPKHSSRSYTPAQQMRAKIAASQGKIYNPANPTPVNPAVFKGTKMGQVITPGGRKTSPTQQQNLNSHQFGLRHALHIYEKVIKPHAGRNKEILEGLAKNAGR